MSELAERLSILNAEKRYIEKAMEAEKALDWLQRYGPKGPQSTNELISAHVSINYASACEGSKEAARFLEEAIRQMYGEISGAAIALTQDAISIAKGPDQK